VPSEQLMNDMGKLIEEMIRTRQLVGTAGLRPTKEVIGGCAVLEAKSKAEAIELTKRFLKVHGDGWDIECEVRQLDGPEFGSEA
jgi:hypothetical protein